MKSLYTPSFGVAGAPDGGEPTINAGLGKPDDPRIGELSILREPGDHSLGERGCVPELARPEGFGSTKVLNP
jgi:hypothetical protein